MANYTSAVWSEIKHEYITKGTSLRNLAKKYGPTKDTICARAKKEDWEGQKRRHQDMTETKLLETDTQKKVDYAREINEAANMLVANVKQKLMSYDPITIDTGEMKDMSVVLRNAKELLGIKSKKDLEEQDARIDKLRKEAANHDGNKEPVRVVIEGDLDKYSL